MHVTYNHAFMIRCFFFISLSVLLFVSCETRDEVASGKNWSEYLGGPDRNHYSTLTGIDRENVRELEKAWEYHTGDSGQIQCNPLVVDGVLFGMTATALPFALDAASGKEIWQFPDTAKTTWYGTARGVVYWEDNDDKRILFTRESWLYAIDARTGKPIASFGKGGAVSLKSGLGPTAAGKFVISNTPGTVYRDLIIMPLRVSEGSDAAPGHIQAFNIRTGELAWIFKTIPDPGQPGYETWPPDAYKNTDVGGANNWSGMAIDRERDMVFIPTGSAAFDYYGGNRPGANLYANTLLALRASTGELIWHFQFVHHDILDRDAPAPPNLLTVTQNGSRVDAVAQVTKHGYIFLFERETGKPLFPIREVPVPASDVPGEQAWPTQPLPEKPAPFARQMLTENDLSPYAPRLDERKEAFKTFRSEGPFTPLSRNGTIIFPGLDGGAEWGGAAVDPQGIMYVNSSEMAWLISLNRTNPEADNPNIDPGEQIYANYCSACHGSERKGNPASGFPSLVDLGSRLEREHVLKVITSGKGMMPAFRSLSEEQQKNLVAFLYGEKTRIRNPAQTGKNPPDTKPRFNISGFTKYLDGDGYPAISPPWGTLNAIDLNTGEFVWKKVFGEYPELTAKGIPQTGSESYGGPVVTASGLLFIAGTKDSKLRAYDSKNGALLWETTLPAAAFATPATYEVDGRQFVVVACGGTKLGAAKGDSYVAYALPD